MQNINRRESELCRRWRQYIFLHTSCNLHASNPPKIICPHYTYALKTESCSSVRFFVLSKFEVFSFSKYRHFFKQFTELLLFSIYFHKRCLGVRGSNLRTLHTSHLSLQRSACPPWWSCHSCLRFFVLTKYAVLLLLSYSTNRFLVTVCIIFSANSDCLNFLQKVINRPKTNVIN